jgi:hypothetical protein
MPTALELWRESVKQHYDSKNESYKIPRKDTEDYAKIKKIYDKKRGNKADKDIKPSKKCKCRCPCKCEK